MREIKGLLLNNLYLIRISTFGILLAIMLWVIIPILIHYEIAPNDISFITLMGGLLPLYYLESMEHAMNVKWGVFQKCMPVKKENIIVSNYVTYLILGIVNLGIYLFPPFRVIDMTILIYAFILIQLVCIVYFPMLYFVDFISFSKESTGETFLPIIAIGGTYTGVYVFTIFIEEAYMLPVAITLTICLYILSLLISLYLDKRGRKARKRIPTI